MKGFIALLLCLFCLSGCGYSLQGSWKGGPEEKVKMEFRSDGSILEQGVKAELLTWHGDYICLNTKKIRDAQMESLARQKKQILDAAEEFNKKQLDNIAQAEKKNDKPYVEQLEKHRKWYEDEYFGKQLRPIDAQLEQIKNAKGAEWSQFIGMGVDKKDISESADKVEARIHWVDNDHFDLGSTSFSRVKEKD